MARRSPLVTRRGVDGLGVADEFLDVVYEIMALAGRIQGSRE